MNTSGNKKTLNNKNIIKSKKFLTNLTLEFFNTSWAFYPNFSFLFFEKTFHTLISSWTVNPGARMDHTAANCVTPQKSNWSKGQRWSHCYTFLPSYSKHYKYDKTKIFEVISLASKHFSSFKNLRVDLILILLYLVNPTL